MADRSGDGGVTVVMPRPSRLRGLAIAGDWVGPSGMLADAAMRSGQDAAAVVMAGTIATARETVAA